MNLFAFVLAAAGLLQIFDEGGRQIAARVEVLDSQGRQLQVTGRLPIHPGVPALGVVIDREAALELPPGAVRLRVSRGTEYMPIETAGSGAVRLRRWINMAARGWWSGDLHVHRLPPDMPLLLEAADLHFAPTITRWNEMSDLGVWPERRVYTNGNRAYSVDNCEDERGWGAAVFIGARSQPRLPARKTNRHYPSGVHVCRQARQNGAFIDLEKAIWWGTPVVAALVRPDSIGVAVNHFMESGMLEQRAWGRPRDMAKYPGEAGFAHYMFDLYYTYLNAGMRVAASAGSANGVLRNPLGYNRSYVYLGNRFSAESWLAGQKAGRNFVTNGPMLFLKVDGQMPGAVIESQDEVSVQLEALADGELERAELLVNGTVVKTFEASGNGRRIAASGRVKIAPGGWLAARCFQKSTTIRFAHTSPIYRGRTPHRAPEALKYLKTWIDADMERVRELPDLSDAEREELMTLRREARNAYR